jgi:sugar transferase (PEP-CTERM/EpsH1 system associated)
MTGGLHVAHVTLALDVGGLERNIVNQARVAPATGQRVTVICVERPGVLAGLARDLGAEVVCLDKQPGFRLGVAARMRSVLRALRPDVVHTHEPGPLFYTSLATVGLGVPLQVHTEHGRQAYHGRRLRWLARTGARRARVFYCLTEDMADWVTGHGVVPRSKVRVIHNGIDTAAYRDGGEAAAVRAELGIPAGAPVVTTVGRLVEIKRQEVLLRAFARVQVWLPEAHLVLVGDGPRRAELEQLARELEIAPRVRFAGTRPSSAPFLHASDVFALTSRSEGMPQSLLEAGVAGVPVIASAVGGIPELVTADETGMLFPSGDAEALADGLFRLLTDRPFAERLAAAARARVEARYSIRRMAAEYDAQFRELLAARLGRGRWPARSGTEALARA